MKWKYGKEEPPKAVLPISLEDGKKTMDLIEKSKVGKTIEKSDAEKTENTRQFNVFVDGEQFEVEVDEPGGAPVVVASAPVASSAPAPKASATPAATAKAAPVAASVDGTPIVAPMPGMVIKFEKQIGEKVSTGDTVLILEAMKMENAITAPCDGEVKAINFGEGDSVAKDDVLCVIG